jgi:uncharacterized NAD(P)/FAD-binding protein YdhS
MNVQTPLASKHITIIGGGFSGASIAIQLVRASQAPLHITIIEPRSEVGRGIAHSADDPDHRLNGTINQHFIDPGDPDALNRLCTEKRLAEKDPSAIVADGNLFIRRKDFGLFVAETLKAHATWPTGSTIRHLQGRATGVAHDANSVSVETSHGQQHIASDMIIVATGNALPRLPAQYDARLNYSANVVPIPTDLERVRAIPKSARVLVLGSGLTALDVISTLLRSGHKGQITAVSRRGLRPSPQRPKLYIPTTPLSKDALLARVEGPVPTFIQAAGYPPTTRGLTKALRQQIRQVESTGDLWYTPFDEVRDVLWQIWPKMSLKEKIRCLKRMRSWWDTYRFRSPPQNEALVRKAESLGHVIFRTTRISAILETPDGSLQVTLRDQGFPTERVESFDALINCTGLDSAAGAKDNPVLGALLSHGLISVDPTGIGFAVDAQCSAIDAEGRVNDKLRIIGPPTNGTFGDQVGAPFIAMQIGRAVPSMLMALDALTAPSDSDVPILQELSAS